MTMTDDSSPTRKIVAWARWFHFPAGDFGSWTERWVDQLPENMSFEKLGPAFLDKMASQHVRALSGRPHWFLEVLVTHEDYRGLGLGSRLVKWGTEQADKEGVECYLDGGAKAQPLYEKFGFEVVDCMEEGVLSKPMRRDLKVPN
jgi:GNAT superfamily N-acetyltransferase